MKRTIEDLWNGNIASAENCGVGDPEIEHLVLLMERHREQLGQGLGQQQKSIFEKYVEYAENFMWQLSRRAFCDGFSLASRLLTEALSEST